jgi:adenylate cyclase
VSRLRSPLLAGGLLVLLLALVTAVYRLGWPIPGLSGPLAVAERESLDWRFGLRGPQPASAEVVVLAYDDRTIQQQPELFEKRAGFARVLTALAGSGARAVGVDALFVDHERILPAGLTAAIETYLHERSGAAAAPDAPAGPAAEADALLRRVYEQTRGDERLSAAIRRAPAVVLAFHLGASGHDAAATEAAKAAYGQAVAGPRPPPPAARATLSLPAFNAAADALGYVTVTEDATHAVRQIPAARTYRGRVLAPLAVQLAAARLGVPRSRRVYLGRTGSGRPALQLGGRRIPLNLDHGLWLNYRGGPGSFTTHSVIDLVEGRLAPGALRDKIVLLGFTYFGHDNARTPFSSAVPGVEVHATAVDNLLAGDWLHRSPWWLDALIVLGFGLLLVLLYWPRWRLGPLLRFGGSLLLLAGYLFATQLAFARAQLWLPWVGPLSAFGLVSLVCLALSYLGEERARRRLRVAFAHYLSDDVIEQLIERPGALKLGGERRELSVLFSDIRGFTGLAEGLSPERLTELLNGYLTPMTEIVLAQRGLLDKYIGDAIMAVFGAPLPDPNHAAAACETALRMSEALVGLRVEWRTAGLPELEIGIGINTGPMSVGNMGSAERFDYTVVGDHVNLGSRIEGLNKRFGTRILVSQTTRRAVGPAFTFREIDRVAVKGKRAPVRLFELRHRGPPDPEADAWLEDFQGALAAYRARRFDEAAAAFDRLAAERADRPSAVYAQRCRRLAAEPPGEHWDGVLRADTK